MDGVVNLLKPPGVSSNTAANIVRGIVGASRAGHAGTLDPGAAGVLCVCLDRATRLSDYLMDCPKRYVFEVTFGAETSTQDSCGEVTGVTPMKVEEADILAALPAFTGTVVQNTPAYSAVKVDGVPLYRLARRGKETPVKTREVVVHSLTIKARTGEHSWLMDVTCSKGTYVRTLCADLGRALGGVAYMSFLLRTGASGLTIDSAVTIDELRAMDDPTAAVLGAEEALKMWPGLTVDEDTLINVFHGRQAKVDAADGCYRLYCGEYRGFYSVREGRLRAVLPGVI